VLHIANRLHATRQHDSQLVIDPTRPETNILKAEIHALESSGRLPASAYKGATMYTTLSPCDMCTGACILYKVSRVVLGENSNFVGGEKYLKQRDVEVVNLDDVELKLMMGNWIRDNGETWWEDIGEGKGTSSKGVGI
jgi:creatinine deaminase